MKRLYTFFKTNIYAIWWTTGYIFVMWAILRFMFNFDMFSRTQWIRLMHAELTGFPGFVFGILLLAAIPTYIATTAIVIRTRAPLFKISVPTFIKKMFSGPLFDTPPAPVAQPTQTTPPPATEPATPTVTEPVPVTPRPIPGELRDAFTRARQNVGPSAISAFNNIEMNTPNSTPVPTPVMAGANVAHDGASVAASDSALPLPPDFDFDEDVTAPDFNGDDFTNMAPPTFTDISFDDTAAAPTSTTDDETIEYLGTHNHKIISHENGIILTDRFAIATHDDADFWIADAEYWFAAGIQKSSPIVAITTAATEHNVRPVMYLRESNIMDLDTHRAEWDAMGIITISDLDELPE